MRGADQRHVNVHRPVPAQRHDFALLQHAQQARLQRQRHVANLIQKQGAAIGLQQLARRPFALGAGEGAFLVAKEFGLDQRLGDGGAVDRHKRRIAALAEVVDGIGQQLFAGAGFTQNQNGNVLVNDVADFFDHRAHMCIAKVEVVELVHRSFGAQGRVLHRLCRDLSCRGRVIRDEGRADRAHRHCRLAPAHPHEDGGAVGEVHSQGGERGQPQLAHQVAKGLAKQRAQALNAQGCGAGADDFQAGAVGAQHLAVLVKRNHAFFGGANQVHAGVKVQLHRLAEFVPEPVVLDRARAHVHQHHGVRVKGAFVTRHIKHADQVFRMVHDGRGGA